MTIYKKMKRILFYKILIIATVIASCKKIDLPDPVDGPIVFSAAVQVNGTAKKWEAGVDDYYMFSEFQRDNYDVYEFSGRFQQENCAGQCGEILTIRIRDLKQTTGVFSGVGDALRVDGNYGFYSLVGGDTIWSVAIDTVGYRVTFDAGESEFATGAGAYTWDFGDSSTTALLDPVVEHTYGPSIMDRQVGLTVSSNNQLCSGSIVRTVNPATSNPINQDCGLTLQVDSTNLDTTLTIMALPVGAPPFLYSWNDGSTSQSVEVFSPSGQVSASVTLTDATGCTASAGLATLYVPGIMPAVCIARFDYESRPDTVHTVGFEIVPGDSLQFSGVTIEYTDAEGRFYSSGLLVQPPSSYFEILKVEDYDLNEKGQKTKKLTVRFACDLWDTAGGKIVFKEGEAVIAVAYP
ncbi:MAG: hypothetical protein H6577_21225 [Lewinellaceae bacterium]|nr:hypothetical protein [Saprospiraceae bacterium]MCB9340653.1 hypothetical protein [Lewinellaceae bacterium]